MVTYSKVVNPAIAALLKKEYGFDEDTVYFWEQEEDSDTVKLKRLTVTDSSNQEFFTLASNSKLEENQYSAPFIYQVLEWLQDKGFWVTIDNNGKKDEEEREFSWCITNVNSQTREFRSYEMGLFKTFEEAAEDGIKRALFILYLAE